MEHRNITADELERIEREELHHEDEERAGTGPASEAEVVDTQRPPDTTPVIPPNPD